jgi:hypothetical protein
MALEPVDPALHGVAQRVQLLVEGVLPSATRALLLAVRGLIVLDRDGRLDPAAASSARFVLKEYALSASTRSGRVRERPRPILGTRMLLSTAANCGLSPRCPAVTTRDISFWPCSQARCSLLVSPLREQPRAWSAGSPTGGSACADGSCRAPAACWWARVTVESTETSHVISPASSARACSAVRIACQTPSSCQRQKSQYTHYHGPYHGGTSRHGTPALVRHRIPSIKRRFACTGGRPGFMPRGSTGLSTAHCASVRSWRAKASIVSTRGLRAGECLLGRRLTHRRPHTYGCCDTPQRSDRDQRQPTPNPLLKRTLAPATDRTLRQRKPVPAEPTPAPGS